MLVLFFLPLFLLLLELMLPVFIFWFVFLSYSCIIPSVSMVSVNTHLDRSCDFLLARIASRYLSLLCMSSAFPSTSVLCFVQNDDEDIIYVYNAYLHKLMTCFLSHPLARDKVGWIRFCSESYVTFFLNIKQRSYKRSPERLSAKGKAKKPFIAVILPSHSEVSKVLAFCIFF